MARKVRIGRVEDFPAGVITEREVEGEKVIVVQDAEGLCAAHNKCPHLGLSLHPGRGAQVRRWGHPVPVAQLPVRGQERGEPRLGARCRRPVDALVVAQADLRRAQAAPLTTYTVIVEDDEVFIEM